MSTPLVLLVGLLTDYWSACYEEENEKSDCQNSIDDADDIVTSNTFTTGSCGL